MMTLVYGQCPYTVGWINIILWVIDLASIHASTTYIDIVRYDKATPRTLWRKMRIWSLPRSNLAVDSGRKRRYWDSIRMYMGKAWVRWSPDTAWEKQEERVDTWKSLINSSSPAWVKFLQEMNYYIGWSSTILSTLLFELWVYHRNCNNNGESQRNGCMKERNQILELNG